MKNFQILAILASMLLPVTALAEVPRVVSDIPTTHSLVASVMGELGEPTLLMQASASPHDYALRPSEAASLEAANLIIWTSSELTPWLSRAVHSLAQDAHSVQLMKASGTQVLGFRNTIEHIHEHEHEEHNEPNTDEHNSTNGIDPHGWLDPVNAQHWLQLIAEQLSKLDPENALIYQDNARKEIEEIDQLNTVVAQQLDLLTHRSFIVFHDSYRYFEERFKLPSTAAISLADAEHPSIKRLNSLRDILDRHPGACVFAEPQFSQRLIKTISSGHNINIGELDPLGAQLQPGASLYRGVITQLANSLSDCLSKP